jgi:hypothetical protein
MGIKAPDRAVDLAHGEQVFAQTCAACHGADGLGKRATTGNGYQFPPLWEVKVGPSIPFPGFASAIEVRGKSPFEKYRPMDRQLLAAEATGGIK